MPVYILIISTFVTILELLLEHYIKPLYDVLGIYLPLIVVNCIVLGRAISTASKKNVKTSFLDAIGIGLGYTFVLMIIALFREVIGNNTLTLIDSTSKLFGTKVVYRIFTPNNIFPINILVTPAGSFITLALLIALFNYLKGGKKNESN